MDVREAVQIDAAYQRAMREAQAALVVISHAAYAGPSEDSTDRIHDRMSRVVSYLLSARRLLRIDRPNEESGVGILIRDLTRAMVTLETSTASYVQVRDILSRTYTYLGKRV